MSSTPRDDNRVPALFGVTSIDGETAIPVYVDSSTHELYIKSITAIPTTSVANSTASGTIDALNESIDTMNSRVTFKSFIPINGIS